MLCKELTNGWRLRSSLPRVCPVGVLVVGMRQRHFDGTRFKLRKMPENAQRPTCWLHSVLGGRLLLVLLRIRIFFL